jgi:three-Cys-motif partner protein
MAKQLATLWPLEEHTAAKHELLTRYLSRWVPIFQFGYAKSDHLVFVDGFAGPGVYAGGEPGSPVLMIREFLKAKRQPGTTLHCFFVEADKARSEELERRVARFRNAGCEIEIFCGDYAQHHPDIRARVAKLPPSPVFAFLDPFGAVEDPDLAMGLTLRPRTEALVYLPVGNFARFIDKPPMERNLNAVFGDDRWKALKGKSTAEITRGMVSLYSKLLGETSSSRGRRFYVEHFAIQPRRGTRYYLFFATSHPRAVEAMREAMWHIDKANGCLFDPRHPSQPGLETWKPELAADVHRRFPQGTAFTFDEAWEWVVENKPPFDQARLRAALTHLRDQGVLEVLGPNGKPSRRGFPPGRSIRVIA